MTRSSSMWSRLVRRTVDRCLVWIAAASITLLLACVGGCRGVKTGGELIDQFSKADCLSPSERDSQSRLLWRSPITTRSGIRAVVLGRNDINGQIHVQFDPDPESVVAVFPKDFLGPTDVRVDINQDWLFVRAYGHAAFGGDAETWLYKYDLRDRKVISESRVDPSVLPKECR